MKCQLEPDVALPVIPISNPRPLDIFDIVVSSILLTQDADSRGDHWDYNMEDSDLLSAGQGRGTERARLHENKAEADGC